MLEPMVAPQPRKDRNQDADDDEEAERNHPYPQPVAFALFPEPGVAVANKRLVSQIIHFSFERDKGPIWYRNRNTYLCRSSGRGRILWAWCSWASA